MQNPEAIVCMNSWIVTKSAAAVEDKMFGQIVYILKACSLLPPLLYCFSNSFLNTFMRKIGSKLTEVLISLIFYCRYNIVKIQTSGTHQDVC